ncbi:MAG TPA: thioesterase domain-containing protein [Burkholderiales bacterium]|nr:thioesterase domain-containing protein [Burkholderiales bacterium]
MNARVEISDDLLELEISELWKRLLRRDEIGLDEDFFEAGGDSITAVQMLLELENLAGYPYPQAELAELTIRRVAAVLKAAMPSKPSCMSVVHTTAPSADLDSRDLWTRLRALRRLTRALQERAEGCLTHAGGASGVPFFFCHGDFQARGIYAHRLATLLPQEQPVYLLHPEQEPAPGTTVEELAQRYLEEIRHAAPGMPVILGGYCNGGYVAWHLAHLLRARGLQVLGVFLVETPSLNARPLLRAVAQAFHKWPRLQELGTRAVRSLYRHGPKDFFARLVRAVRRGVRDRRPPAAPASWWTFVRGMSARYVPPAIDADVYCFVAEEESRLETQPARWRALARSVTEIVVPGGHLSSVIAHRHGLAAAFADAIAAALERHRLTGERATPPRCRSQAAPVARTG